MVTRRLPGTADAPTRLYAIGDVHGHADRLAAMHEAIRRDLATAPTPRPLLIHLGDYIDRGPDSARALSLVGPAPPLAGVPTVNLIGNHERMLLNALESPSRETAGLWLENGGASTLASWGIRADDPRERWGSLIPPAHLRLLRGLALHHRAGQFLFVHAGVRPGAPLAEQRPHDLVWIRLPFLAWDGAMLPEAPETIVVHGHTPELAPVVRRHRIGIDTGAAYGGPLTCVVLGAEEPRFLAV